MPDSASHRSENFSGYRIDSGLESRYELKHFGFGTETRLPSFIFTLNALRPTLKPVANLTRLYFTNLHRRTDLSGPSEPLHIFPLVVDQSVPGS